MINAFLILTNDKDEQISLYYERFLDREHAILWCEDRFKKISSSKDEHLVMHFLGLGDKIIIRWKDFCNKQIIFD